MIPEPRVAGNYGGREDAIMLHKCIDPPAGCGRDIPSAELDTYGPRTLAEYKQSGWCWKCQSVIFKDPEAESDCTCDTPCCEVDVGVGVLDCGSQHCRVHGEPWKE